MLFGGVQCEPVDKLTARAGDYFFYNDARGRRVGQIAMVDESLGFPVLVTVAARGRPARVTFDQVVSVWRQNDQTDPSE
jgi:hypothetical protein